MKRFLLTFVLLLFATVATPTFDHDTGTYINSVTVTISDSTPFATICYTIDGTTPGASSAGTCDRDGHTVEYSGPITITVSGTVLKAIGTLGGDLNSGRRTATYTIVKRAFRHRGGIY